LYLCCQIVNKVIKREEESTQPQAKVCFWLAGQNSQNISAFQYQSVQ
jgi:hypothetical protein